MKLVVLVLMLLMPVSVFAQQGNSGAEKRAERLSQQLTDCIEAKSLTECMAESLTTESASRATSTPLPATQSARSRQSSHTGSVSTDGTYRLPARTPSRAPYSGSSHRVDRLADELSARVADRLQLESEWSQVLEFHDGFDINPAEPGTLLWRLIREDNMRYAVERAIRDELDDLSNDYSFDYDW